MILFATGARPNFIKVKPLIDKCVEWKIPYITYNSLQHDSIMRVFDIPTTIKGLSRTSSQIIPKTRPERFAYLVNDFSVFLNEYKPKVVVVVGDTDTSLACALCADMKGIPVAHVEAGLRSYYKMPEETNRIAIDSLSTFNFTPTVWAQESLWNDTQIIAHHVGNIAVEALIKYYIQQCIRVSSEKDYILIELHRPENDAYISKVIAIMDDVKFKVVWVKHPRYREDIYKANHITFLSPQSYVDMCKLVDHAKLLLTDSGGLQVDSTYLNVPCITLRENTEWLDTINYGTNTLVKVQDFVDKGIIFDCGEYYKETDFRTFTRELWDDKVSERILTVLKEVL